MSKKKRNTIKWAFRLAWNIDKKMMIIWLLLSMVVSILPSLTLILNKRVLSLLTSFLQYNNIQANEIFKYVLFLGIVMIFDALSRRLNGDLVYMVMYDSYYLGMQEYLMDNINKIELDNLLKKDINDQYNASFVRAGSLTNFLSSFVILINKVFSILMLLVVALRTSFLIFIVSLIYTVVVILFNTRFVEKLRFSNDEYQSVQRLSKFYSKMPMDIGVAKEIRVFDLENYIIEKWKKSFQKLKDYELNKSSNMELRNFISAVLFALLVIIQIVYSIVKVSQGMLSSEECLVIYILCSSLFTHIACVARIYMETDYGLFALEKQYDFITSAPVRDETKDKEKFKEVSEQEVVFEAKDLEFHYGNQRSVLDHLNFKIYKGEVVALIGENGCGKTTLTKVLLSMYRPTGGQMLFYGKEYENYQYGIIAEKIGTFFQDTYLFHTPLSDNIAYSNLNEKNNENKIRKAIENGGAKKVLDKLPNGLDTIMGKDVIPEGVELSGGEKQLIAVSRAVMSNRDIMIYDEPAAKLDPIAEMIQFQNIKNGLDKKTAILISHRMGFARLADRIFVMQMGKIVEEGTHNELIEKKGIYYNMFMQQAMWYDN